MISASDLPGLAGMTLVGRDGRTIGTIRDVYVSAEGGSATFATVTTGLFGTHASFVPLHTAELRGDAVVVPYDKDQVRHAPRLDTDEELSTAEEERLHQHYALEGAAAADAGDVDEAMTRSEERLQVGTERVETGRARLRKHVVTQTETRTVPVSHEELVIERVQVTDGDLGVVAGGEQRLTASEQEIVLTAERPVVDTQVVPVERVRLTTETVTGEAVVTERLAAEQVRLEQDEAAGPPPGERP